MQVIRSNYYASDMRHKNRKRISERARARRILAVAYAIGFLLTFGLHYGVQAIGGSTWKVYRETMRSYDACSYAR